MRRFLLTIFGYNIIPILVVACTFEVQFFFDFYTKKGDTIFAWARAFSLIFALAGYFLGRACDELKRY